MQYIWRNVYIYIYVYNAIGIVFNNRTINYNYGAYLLLNE